jgi:hypothetical protein
LLDSQVIGAPPNINHNNDILTHFPITELASEISFKIKYFHYKPGNLPHAYRRYEFPVSAFVKAVPHRKQQLHH